MTSGGRGGGISSPMMAGRSLSWHDPRPLCGIVARSGLNQEAAGGSGAAAYLPRDTGATGAGTGATAWRPVSRLFMGTLVIVLKNNALFISEL